MLLTHICPSSSLWSLDQAKQLLSYAVYRMGDTPTVQDLKRELDLFIRLRTVIPGNDVNGVIADQQAKCNAHLYKRMGFQHAWAAEEKTFLENFVDIPSHLGKPYAYLSNRAPKDPRNIKGNSHPSPPFAPKPNSVPMPKPSSAKPPSPCRTCNEWHWARDCPKKSS